MYRACRAIFLTLGLATLVGLPAANATVITVNSADFSFGFGANNDVAEPNNIWDLQNAGTENVNTPSTGYTQGDFVLTPSPTGAKFSGTGPKFEKRTLSNGSSGWVSGNVLGFSMPISAAYTGTIPADATNIRLQLEITNISVWAACWQGSSTDLAWNETTPGQIGQSSSVALKSPVNTLPAIMDIANYTQVAWDPSDAYVSLATAGASVTRTFNFGSAFDVPIDGIDVMGRIHLTYETASVPEPGTMALGFMGLIGLLAYAWRKWK